MALSAADVHSAWTTVKDTLFLHESFLATYLQSTTSQVFVSKSFQCRVTLREVSFQYIFPAARVLRHPGRLTLQSLTTYAWDLATCETEADVWF